MNSMKSTLFFSFIFSVIFFAVPAFAGPIDDLKPGEWYEIPNSKLRAVVPNPAPPGIVGPPAVVNAWGGAAYDTKRNRYLVWGGGHGDYGGNELYAFDLNTLKWSRIWGPSSLSVIPPVGSSCNEAYSDGNPASRHTYDGLEYIPSTDRFWAQGGSLYCGSGGFGNGTWTFNFNSAQWERKQDSNGHPTAPVFSAYDSVTGHTFVHRYTIFSEYDPINDTWFKRGGFSAGISPTANAVIDPKRKKFVMIGGGTVRWYDLSQSGSLNLTTITTTGDTTPVGAKYPGVEYDPLSDRIVAWVGGTHVYTLNLDTLVWTKIQAASTNTVIPSSPTQTGTHSRWRYIPSKNAFMIVNSIDQNIYVYKLSSGGGTPPPPSPPFDFSLANGGSESVIQGQSVSNDITASVVSGTSQPVSFSTAGLPSGATSTYSATSCSPTCTVSLNISTANNTPIGNYVITSTASGGGITKTTSFTLTVNGSTPPPPSSSGRINIPLNQWVARPIPTDGTAPCSYGECKHIAITYNPDDQLLYFLGGDHNGSSSVSHQSGRNEMYTYSVARDQWNLIQPFCRTDNGLQPDGPDEVGWAYDSFRKQLWMMPGYLWGRDSCANDLKGPIMTYSPASGSWTVPAITQSPRGTEGNFTQYDPVTDTLLRFANAGPEVNIYTIATDSWARTKFGLPNENFSDVGTTIDVAGRRIFLLTANKLYEYNIDTQTIADRGPTPRPTYAETKPVWDSVNQVLLWPDFRDSDTSTGAPQEQVKLHVYHPNTKTWDADVPVMQPSGGIPVKGRHAIFDPVQNIMLVFGNVWNRPNVPYIFLYRYGDGSGTPPPPPPPQCSDGFDNDNDGLVDLTDPGCTDSLDNDEKDSSTPPSGTVKNADPSNYQTIINGAQPGDTIILAAGDYGQLYLRNIHGSAKAYITITGPTSGAAAVFHAASCCNTVNIGPASYLRLQNLEIDGDGHAASFAVNSDNWSHHIVLENLYIHDQAVRDNGTVVGDNQDSAISTKGPASNWIIRNNRIITPGVGMYLGNSDQTQDFVGGIIEGNLIVNPIGYGIQIKAQGNERDPAFGTILGMATSDERTIIRHNVIIKTTNYGIAARPNLLVGGFPDSGPGANDHYEIYGNFLYQNPTECLGQLTGAVAFYDNILVNSMDGCGLLFTPHDGKALKNVWAYNNTIVATGDGIKTTSPASGTVQQITGNAVFAAAPLSGGIQADNVTDSYASAGTYLNNPFGTLGTTLDLFPQSGKLSSTVLDRSAFQGFADWDKDFNGIKNNETFRGAYAGSGTNPGWPLSATNKPIPAGATPPIPPGDSAPLAPTGLTVQ